jgi:phage virion morphogenesis protein
MAGAFAELTIEGLGPAIAALNALSDPNLAALGLAHIGGLVESQTRERFTTRIAPDGTAWPAWSERYAASRRKGHSLLVADGHLRDSIMWEMDGDELRIGSNLVYAAIHQFGGEAGMAPGPAAIPARAYLGVSEADIAEIDAELNIWIEGVLH